MESENFCNCDPDGDKVLEIGWMDCNINLMQKLIQSLLIVTVIQVSIKGFSACQ